MRNALLLSLLIAAAPACAQKNARPIVVVPLKLQGIVAEVVESARADSVLSVRIRLRNTGDRAVSVRVVEAGDFNANYVSAENRKYLILHTPGGKHAASPADGSGNVGTSLKQGESWTWWAKFPAPPRHVRSYTYYWPLGDPIERLPIRDPAEPPRGLRR
jgi:hypothetical protein